MAAHEFYPAPGSGGRACVFCARSRAAHEDRRCGYVDPIDGRGPCIMEPGHGQPHEIEVDVGEAERKLDRGDRPHFARPPLGKGW